MSYRFKKTAEYDNGTKVVKEELVSSVAQANNTAMLMFKTMSRAHSFQRTSLTRGRMCYTVRDKDKKIIYQLKQL